MFLHTTAENSAQHCVQLTRLRLWWVVVILKIRRATNASRWKAKMEITITVTAYRKREKPFTKTGVIDVPDKWPQMDNDDKREWLMKPVSESWHKGVASRTLSRLQRLVGDDPIKDFVFSTPSNTASTGQERADSAAPVLFQS
jgi:hypothetical protein